LEKLIDKIEEMIDIKTIKILSDGTLNFAIVGLKSLKQIKFYEKDYKNHLKFKRPTKYSSTRNVTKNAFKSKYKL
jgi:hypothetical protein